MAVAEDNRHTTIVDRHTWPESLSPEMTAVNTPRCYLYIPRYPFEKE